VYFSSSITIGVECRERSKSSTLSAFSNACHTLRQWACLEIAERIFPLLHRDRLFFHENKNIFDFDPMAKGASQVGLSKADIQRWEQETVPTKGTIDEDLVQRLFNALLQTLRRILLHPSVAQHKPSAWKSTLTDTFHILSLWGFESGISSGDLNSMLQSTPNIKESALSILIVVATTVSRGMAALSIA